MSSEENMVVCDNVMKIYKTKEVEVVALQGLDLTVCKGEMMAVIGNSGSGKSTLLNLLGGLDMPSAGKVTVDGMELDKLSLASLRKYKKTTVGFVWQNTARNLVPYLSALENVALPMRINGKADRPYARSLLDYVGLGGKAQNKLFELSGGEQQRVAIAIALSNKPPLILADEPTGAVDTKTTADILNLFKRVSAELGATIVIVTHDRQISTFVDRVAAMRDGRASSEFIRRRYDLELGSIESRFHEKTHEEYAVLDKFGRMQLPQSFVEGMGRGNRVKLQVEDGKVTINTAD